MTIIEQRDEIMRSFDFKKVQDVMEHLGWYWGVSPLKKKEGVPSLAEIKACALYLLNATIKSSKNGQEYAAHSTGGLEAEWVCGRGGLRLQFVLEYYPEGWDSEIPDDKGVCDVI